MSSAAQSLPTLKFRVEVISGPHAGTIYNFDKETVTIGRGPENDIILSNDLRVSRQHAEIKLNGTEHYILNLSQKNFVLVNGVRAQSEKLELGAVIFIGESELKFSSEKQDAAAKIAAPLSPAFGNVTPIKPVSAKPAPPIQPVMHSPAPRPLQQAPLGYPTQNSMPMNHQPLGAAQNSTPFGTNHRPLNPNTGGGGISGRVKFYGIIVILGFVAWFFLSGTKKPGRDPNAIRTSDQVTSDLQTADKMIEQLEKKKRQMNEVQYSRAQENFIKAFRDYQQGQYGRARESFQVVLNLDPDNTLAQRYLRLSQIKFDDTLKHSMMQGSRYREKKNWRLCQSSFFNAMTMLQNRKDDPTYQEAKRYYDECALNAEGRF